MHNRFDQLGKNIGRSALHPSGVTVANDEITPDAHHADLRHEPDPAQHAARARLGLLGRMVTTVCLLELFSSAPGEEETLACLGKLIAFRQKRRREAEKQHRARSGRGPLRTRAQTGAPRLAQPDPSPETAAPFRPFLWIVAAGRPTTVLAALGARPSRGWPPGVYFSPGVLPNPGGGRARGLPGAGGLLRLGVVVASELPRDRSTLLVRLMAAGPLLPDAIAELGALPKGAHERAVATEILLRLHHVLQKKPTRTPEEEDFVVRVHDAWEDALEKGRKEGHKEGHKEGRKEGQVESAAGSVLTVLRVRNIPVPAPDRERILAERDPARLQRWLERAVVAASLADVLGEPS